MRRIGKSARFGGLRKVGFALIIALGLLGMVPQIGFAGMIPADETTADTSLRAENIAKIQTALERKEIAARLSDHGLTPEEVNARMVELNDEQITELAAQVDQINAGGDAVGLIITIAAIVLVVLIVLWLLNHDKAEVIQSKK